MAKPEGAAIADLPSHLETVTFGAQW